MADTATVIPALYKVTTGAYAEFEARNLPYPLGVLTYITSGAHAGRMKIGDGFTGWKNRPFLVPQATETLLGLIKSSATHLHGHVDVNGLLSINGLELDLASIQEKNTEQDDEISAIKQQLAGMSGTIIYIGSVAEYTAGLDAMDAADRDAFLLARAVELRGQVMDGYTLQDLGLQDIGGRFHYWQYQPDGTWFDLGERGDVSQATDGGLGVVMGSAAQYKIHIEPDGAMSVNGLADKLTALDDKDGELEAAIDGVAGALETFETAQAATNAAHEEAISAEKTRAEGAETALDGKISAEKTRAEGAEADRIEKSIFADTNNALVADMAVMPEEGSLANIRKSLKNVDNGDNYDIDVHVKSLNGSIASALSKQDEHNYTLNLEVKDVAVTDGAADGSLIGAAAKTLAAWFQGIRNNLKSLFENKVDKLTGSTDCDRVYVKHADGTQGYQELWAEPVANSIPSRDDDGVLYAHAGSGANAVVVNSQMSEAIDSAVSAEAEARDEAIAAAKLAIQTWLAAVATKAELPAPQSLSSDVNYLCRVINDADTPANNGVWQLVAGAAEWTYFSDNLDFVDETELQTALDSKVDTVEGKGLSTNDYTDAEKQDAADILTRPTSLQTTDPPTYLVARIDVTAGGAGYEAGDTVTISEPGVSATVSAVDETGAITALSFNKQTVYETDPAAVEAQASGGSGAGAVFSVRTAYAPGDVQKDGELKHVPYSDPLVQTSRMRGYVKSYLEGSDTARDAYQASVMRRWSPAFLYGAGDITNLDGAWYTPNSEDMPLYGESPATNPEKWLSVSGTGGGGGGIDAGSALQILKNKSKIDTLWYEVFGNKDVQFSNHFALDLFSLDGVDLEDGVWNDMRGRVEV